MKIISRISEKIKYQKYYIVIILAFIFFIFGFVLNNSTMGGFAGSILIAGVTCYDVAYERKLSRDKSKILETNFKRFVSNEVEFNVSQLGKFQSEITILKQLRFDRDAYAKPDTKPQVNIIKWGDYTFCFEFIEPEEFNNLLIFYRQLENISEYSCHDIVSKDKQYLYHLLNYNNY